LRVLRDDPDGQAAEHEIVGLVTDDLMIVDLPDSSDCGGAVAHATASGAYLLTNASGKFLFVPGRARGFWRELVCSRTLLLTKSKSSPVVIILSRLTSAAPRSPSRRAQVKTPCPPPQFAP